MEACIEALFNIEGEDGRRKTIEMIRVLKGAISVSKSKTGEVIYHYNRHEKKALRRQLAKYDRDTRQSRQTIEHQKRDILRKWTLVFGRQRNFCESIKVFDDMLAEAIVLRDSVKAEHSDSENEEEDDQEPSEEEKARLAAEEAEKAKKAMEIQDPRKRRLPMKPTSGPLDGSAPAASTGMLPKIDLNAGLFLSGRIETEEEEKERLEREAEEERKRKAKELPRFDRILVKDFLTEQRHIHQDLLTRNALMKIKSQADNDHVFFKYRMKTKLPASAKSLLHHIEHDRPNENSQSRCWTRQSTRSEAGVLSGGAGVGGSNPRLVVEGRRQTGVTKHESSPNLTSIAGCASSLKGDNVTSRSLLSRQSHIRQQRVRKVSDSGPDRTTHQLKTELLTARFTQTADSPFHPKLGERAKTVHFS